jgi:hypothetical protein
MEVLAEHENRSNFVLPRRFLRTDTRSNFKYRRAASSIVCGRFSQRKFTSFNFLFCRQNPRERSESRRRWPISRKFSIFKKRTATRGSAQAESNNLSNYSQEVFRRNNKIIKANLSKTTNLLLGEGAEPSQLKIIKHNERES